jgi:hypothetical protein
MKSLYSAFLKAQSLIGAAIKDKKNPHFRSTYADINSVIEACKDHLNAVGIVISQPIVIDAQGAYVKTILTHAESSESIESVVPLIGATDMQKFGSAVTYARRYGLQSLVLLGAEDDDGNAASLPAPKPVARPAPTPAPVMRVEKTVPAEPVADLFDFQNRAHQVKLTDLCRAMGADQKIRDQAFRVLHGKPLASIKEVVSSLIKGVQ